MISTSMSAVVGVQHFGLFWMVGVLADITSTKPRRTPHWWCFLWRWSHKKCVKNHVRKWCLAGIITLQGTNISPKNGILKMIFLFPRWDVLIPWRVPIWLQVVKQNILQLGGGFKQFLFSPLITCGNDPIWRAYFSDGLVQPPTSQTSLGILAHFLRMVMEPKYHAFRFGDWAPSSSWEYDWIPRACLIKQWLTKYMTAVVRSQKSKAFGTTGI